VRSLPLFLNLIFDFKSRAGHRARLWRIEFSHFHPGNEKEKNLVNPVKKLLKKIESIPIIKIR